MVVDEADTRGVVVERRSRGGRGVQGRTTPIALHKHFPLFHFFCNRNSKSFFYQIVKKPLKLFVHLNFSISIETVEETEKIMFLFTFEEARHTRVDEVL